MKNLADGLRSAETPVAGDDGDAIRVLVADDYPLLREGIKSVIEREPGLLLCGFVDNQRETLDAIANLKPQVVLIAFALDTTATLELIRDTRARYNRTPLLVFPFKDDPALVKQLSRSGAQGLIMRADAAGCLVEAIRRLTRGLHYVGAKASQTMADQMFAAPASHPDGSDSQLFTGREEEILDLIGGGFTSREIAESLRLSVKTVESHRHNIKQKLGVKTSARLAQYAFQWLHSRKTHQS
jgi:DNA-binding NarL/FixJ family response regulator